MKWYGHLSSDDAYRACVAELEAAGLRHRIERGGKHPHLVFEIDGVSYRKILTGSKQSDVRAALKARSDIRRIIREARRQGKAGAGTSLATDPTPAPSRNLVGNETMSLERVSAAESTEAGVMLLGGRVLVSSRSVADRFSKRHDHVLRDIDNLLKSLDSPELGSRMFSESAEPDAQGIARRMFVMTRDGFSLLAMGFTGTAALRWKLLYLDAFNRMENELRALTPSPVVSLSAKEVGGIVKSVCERIANETRAELRQEISAAFDLLAEEMRASAAAPRPPVVSMLAADHVVAFDVVARMAEVPANRRYRGLTSWVTTQLQRAAAVQGIAPTLVPTYPGEKYAFPRSFVAEWLKNGGRARIWQRVTEWKDRVNGQRRLPLRAV